MRRSMLKFIAGAALAASASSPAWAVKNTVNTLPAVVSACDLSLPTPDAIACAGYFSGNLLNGSPGDVTNQQQAIDSLPGSFTWDGNWQGLVDAGLTLSGPGDLTNGNQLNFGTTMLCLLPQGLQRYSGERTVAGERELTSRWPIRALVDDPAN